MTEKEFMEALNHVDDDLIQEALDRRSASPRKKKRLRIPSSVAAVMVLAIGAGAALAGGSLVAQNRKLREPEAACAAAEAVLDETKDDSADTRSMGQYAVKDSYGDLYDALKEMYVNNMIVTDEEVDAVWEEEAVEAPAADLSAIGDEPDNTLQSSGTTGSYSKTNVMTAGVDESDIVKTDGSYIYVVQSGSIRITDIRKGTPGNSLSLTIPFEAPSDMVLEMYVDGGRLVVITSHAEKTAASAGGRRFGNDYAEQTCAYTYDVSDPMSPCLLGKRVQDGFYKTSRKVGGLVYLFTQQALTVPDMEKSEAVKESNLSSWIPTINGEPIAVEDIWVPEQGYYSMVVSSFDASKPGDTIDAKVVMNDYAQIYVGSGHIYLYRNTWLSREITEVSSFRYEDGRITVGAETTVSGGVTDAFALNEKNGMLRILTTDSSTSLRVNTLYVLDEEMKQLGRIDDIAPGEQIYAARFLGDMAYFITYENHDPLFVADLSDPESPKLLGQLEISGFSDYLHVWDETHILGIGYETDEFSNRLGMKLVMFDVSDPANPKAENVKVLSMEEADGDEIRYWYDSNAVDGQYKAILADPDQNLIGFGYDYSNWEENKDSRYYPVISYERESGFTILQNVDLSDSSCPTSEYRGLYVKDYFYLVGYSEIRTFDRKNGFEELIE